MTMESLDQLLEEITKLNNGRELDIFVYSHEVNKENAEKIASKVAELLEGEVKSLEGDKAKWFEVRGEVKGHSLIFTAFYRY